MDSIFNKLNEEQIEAVQHYEGPCMVYAGPGSGKTTVIAYRIVHLIQHHKVNPNNILVITFTKAAAEEMKMRFQQMITTIPKKDGNVNFGTFHSIFFRIIKSYYPYRLENVLNEGERYLVGKNIIKTLQLDNYEDEEFVKDVLLDISLYKNQLLEDNEFQPQSIGLKDFQRVLTAYENYKKDCKKIDFDDMLTECYSLLYNNPAILQKLRKSFTYILIDEFQDINSIQFAIIQLLTKPSNNLFVVGDDDQSIYSFRGAKPRFILDFDKIYPDTKKVILNRNYRSQEKIIDTANSLIENNIYRVKKNILPMLEPGVDINYITPKDKEEENERVTDIIHQLIKMGYNYEEIAIIYRTNITATSIIDTLLDHNIPYITRDHVYNLYDHWVAKDIISYLIAAHNTVDKEAVRRIINKPTRYITRKALSQVMDHHKDLITSLKLKGDLKTYQKKYLENLELDLKRIRGFSTYEAFSYIREVVGYDQYIEDYCRDKSIGGAKLFEILDELEDITKKRSNPQQFLQHVIDFKNTFKVKEDDKTNQNKVQLLTMHGAKGLEFRAVIIVSVLEDVIPHTKSLEDNHLIEEERRLFYVGMTRAKELLYISSPLYKKDKKLQPSRFVEEMKKNCPRITKYKKFHKIIIKHLNERM
ncbi:ATP-dependent helicase [Natronincola ferrireducens]|uniref:DNA 3'-5' helicase n=1 Tax=Natronincola ferrireducens TaxID=393762 RepID=A0A1G9D950_9FIRM|nr:ATP-dependent helicase [Natronincola ferrireducens]SDK60410.1 DNA helicase-2 / ATP-dependent DNA helicase PcrA [Natronincola ferrireducens]